MLTQSAAVPIPATPAPYAVTVNRKAEAPESSAFIGVAMSFGRNAEIYAEGEASGYVYKVLSGVVRGIGGYGNCFGVPTVYSSSDFHGAYDGNILVNAFALGVMKKDAILIPSGCLMMLTAVV